VTLTYRLMVTQIMENDTIRKHEYGCLFVFQLYVVSVLYHAGIVFTQCSKIVFSLCMGNTLIDVKFGTGEQNSLTVNLVTNYFKKLFSHQTTEHIHVYNKIYDTNATNFKSLTYN